MKQKTQNTKNVKKMTQKRKFNYVNFIPSKTFIDNNIYSHNSFLHDQRLFSSTLKNNVNVNNDNDKKESEKIMRKSAKAFNTKTIETNSVNDKMQQRTVGKRLEKNAYGHYEGTIGAKIDKMIKEACFTKKQIEAFAGTKMSKVNSHIHHLRKEKGFNVLIDKKGKIVRFA